MSGTAKKKTAKKTRRKYVKSGKYAKKAPSASVLCDDKQDPLSLESLEAAYGGAEEDDADVELVATLSLELGRVGSTVHAPAGEYEVVYTCKTCGASSVTYGVDMVEKTCCTCFLPMRRAVKRILDEDGD